MTHLRFITNKKIPFKGSFLATSYFFCQGFILKQSIDSYSFYIAIC